MAPAWLIQMLRATHYFQPCQTHSRRRGNVLDLFCIDCHAHDNPICSHCSDQLHNDHRVVQVRRSSRGDVIRVDDVRRHIDTVDVQSYTINNIKVYFLKERSNKGAGRGTYARLIRNNECEICYRSLIQGSRFCSLGCKVEGKNRGHRNVNFIRQGEAVEDGDETTDYDYEYTEEEDDDDDDDDDDDEGDDEDDDESPISSETETEDAHNKDMKNGSTSSLAFDEPNPRCNNRKCTPRPAAK